MGFVKEFREFAVKGNAVDLAVGIVIGAAFGKIVNSLVNDVLMPPIGMLLGNTDFSNFAFVLKEAKVNEAGVVTSPAVLLRYGMFINVLIDFTIVAFALFLIVKVVNRLRRAGEQAEKK